MNFSVNGEGIWEDVCGEGLVYFLKSYRERFRIVVVCDYCGVWNFVFKVDVIWVYRCGR